MAQRPQPSLRFADGGSFITRWAQSVMRPDAAAKRLREADAPPPQAPPPAPVRPPAPPPPPPNPNATPDNPAGIRFQDGGGLSKEAVMAAIARQRAERPQSGGGGSGTQPQVQPQVQPTQPAQGQSVLRDFLRNPGSVLRERERKAELGMQDGGHVPGTGEGDKIPAKYEPGEFVVSNDMIDDNPGLREGLSQMRAETLAARGRTVEEADAKALNGARPSLRAVNGFGSDGEWRGDNRMVQPTAAQNTVDPAARLRSMNAAARATRTAQAPPFNPSTSLGAGTPNNGIPFIMPPDPIKATTSPGAAAPQPPAPPPRPATPPPVLDVERLRTAGVPSPTSTPLPAADAAAYNASPEGRATGRQFAQEKFAQAGGGTKVPPAAPTAPGAPAASPAGPSSLRKAASVVGNGLLYGGAALGGAAVARGMSGVGAGGPSVAVPGERQSGDSANSTQIPTDGYRSAPDAQPHNFWTDSEAGRNIGNITNALAPVGGVAMATRVPGAASRAFGVADAALGGLSAGIHNERASANTATSAATTLRKTAPGAAPDPRDPYAAANAAKIAASDAQNKAAAAPKPGAAQRPEDSADVGRVIRNGNEYSGVNVGGGGNITINGFAPGAGLNRGSQISAQNMAAADALAGSQLRESTGRVQAAQSGGASSADLRRERLMDQLQSREIGGRKTARLALAAMDQQEQAANTRYSSDNSLRGTMYTADSQLGGKQMDAQRKLREQQLTGMLWRESGGDPSKFQSLAMQYGLADTAKLGGDMASASQTRDHNASTNARKRLEGMAVRDDGKGGTVVDPGRLARLESTLGKMAPGWQSMDEKEQAKHLATAEAGVNLLEGLNDRRNNSFWQSIGWDGTSPSLDKLPDMKGAKLRYVGLKEGALTGGGVARKDYVIEVNGQKLYLPRPKVNQGELELLKSRGVDISSMQK